MPSWVLRRSPSGSVRFDGVEIAGLSNRARAPFRRRMQMIFQDPFGSLNPRHTVGAILDGPLAVHRRRRPRPNGARASRA